MVVHRGSIIDFAVDIGNIDNSEVLRFDMSAGDAILIPENYAHGFISLTDETLLQYFLDNVFSEENYKSEDSIENDENEREGSDELFNQDLNEEEDFEIPAFLRKQKF